ncbi:MAG: PbpG [Candidatus Uhrbacteria bacterium GW2011_GWE2_40_58]|nr:MAG: PbpG [Candidatus Uhrbacteria bacterium GW2011_GWF2_40_263]KKR66882.1 MAG: PbpG [Candidatus Uhrbacteria bacterium GW2011_GWE2_40_58]OGL93830.1 MAG: hypothetical protein A2239_04000 [Candidatus Uhrbacteria bacterium RIFOXYA2_FULL_40_9]OGL97978.1 MAG: hypothetical protein A2332_00560 [Candidatus Uhrbacteria bacterium RIFOXYB2_FULL_41_18]HBK35248.1 hypothetical protein [Candidatus Uhrbacteria bacterium]
MFFKLLTQLILATSLFQIFPQNVGILEQYAIRASGENRTSLVTEQVKNFVNATLPLSEEVKQGPTRVNTSSVGVLTTAVSALVMDRETGSVLFEKNAEEPRSIGSITKLMTAYVFLETNPDLNQMASITSEDIRFGGKQNIQTGDVVRVHDLLFASLVGSDNSATAALARLSGMSLGDFIARMNEVAAEIGLKQTTFADTTGLSSGNRSIVSDVAILLDEILKNETIREATQHSSVTFVGSSGSTYYIESTDELLDSYLNQFPYQIIGAKTGYLPEAGYCLGTVFSQEGRKEIIVVVLGSETKQGRFQDVKALAAWTYKVYSWSDSSSSL